jgi:hypothetical protein
MPVITKVSPGELIHRAALWSTSALFLDGPRRGKRRGAAWIDYTARPGSRLPRVSLDFHWRLSRAIAVAVIAAIFCVYPNAAVDRGFSHFPRIAVAKIGVSLAPPESIFISNATPYV